MKKTVFYPVLFALFPIFSLYAVNANRVPFQETLRVTLAVLLVTGFLYLLPGLLTRRWERTGLVFSLGMLLFSTYGHVYGALQNKPNLALGRADVLAAVWIVVFILGGWAAVRVLKKPERLTHTLNAVSIFLLAIPMAQTGATWVGKAASARPDPAGPVDASAIAPSGTRPPDIYYIILDEYSRADVMQEVIAYDNSGFVDYLHGKGFTVAEDAHTNYSITNLSMASSLNYEYLSEDDSQGAYAFLDEIHHSKAREFLESAGYEFVTFSTGYPFSDITNADRYLQPADYLNGFERSYVYGTALALASDAISGEQVRNTMLNTIYGLEKVPAMDPEKPKFVFAHLMAAHVPFVFGPNGEHIRPWAYSADGETGKSYVEAYRDQVTYVNGLLEQAIDTILSTSETPPVIVLQGDHGSEAMVDWTSIEKTCLKERMSILNAYYLPGVKADEIYPSITPVNTFRLIFDHYFGTQLGRLEDRLYFVALGGDGTFNDITGKLVDCPAQPGGQK